MKILLVYDGFDQSALALEEAGALASAEPSSITVLSVVPPDARGSKSGGHVGLRPHAHEDVARAHAYLRERGIDSEMRIAHGDPVEEILAVACAAPYDLIVMGSRGLGPLRGALLGSVTRKVIRDAPCGVIVVTPDAAVPAVAS
ncbi:MAG: universal stress protein [Dehalococcoidia bacterium]